MTLYDVTGIGNAIVDVLSPCDDTFLSLNNIQQASMTLIDQPRAQELYGLMSDAKEKSGGSAANTMAGIGSFGGKGAYIGLVANDVLGDVFSNDMHANHITFNTPRHDGTDETARCYIFVTPDAERSMNTFLGACTELSIDHIDADIIANSKVIYMEGYLFDKAPAKAAFYHAGDIAKNAGRAVSLSLSDSFCVNRHRDDFKKLTAENIDILFANEAEICALFETENFDEAFKKTQALCDIVIATIGKKGAIIANNGNITNINAIKANNLTDLTGAGDQFAAGFLYGYTQGFDMKRCGELGALAAAEVISHVGPRPMKPYKDFL